MDIRVPDLSTISNNFNSKIYLDVTKIGVSGFWAKEVELPDITIDIIETPREGYPIKLPGNMITYGDFTITLFLDEYFEVHKIFYDWIIALKAGTEDLLEEEKVNGSLYILDNSMKNVVTAFDFSGLFPTNIGSLTYTNYGYEPQNLVVTFSYDTWSPRYLQLS